MGISPFIIHINLGWFLKFSLGKTNDTNKGKAPESTHYVVAQCNIGVNEYLFNASLASWKNDWLLDS